MKISIIVSMYRTDHHLKRFISDARKLTAELAKNEVSHEIILVVNNVTKMEQDLLRGLTTPFKILHVELEPIYASWNRGIRETNGEFVTFWGVDDTRFAEAIINGIKNLEEENMDYIYFPFYYYRFVRIFGLTILAKIKTFTPPKFDRERFMNEMHSGPHFMVRRSLFYTIGYFDESFKIAGDFEFQIRAAKKGARFARNPTISGIFRSDGTTLSSSRNELHLEENKRALLQI